MTTLHFIITTFGSAGDIHPFMAIAREAMVRGHTATIISSAHFQSIVEREGIHCIPLGTEEDFQRTLSDPRIWDQDRALGFLLEVLAEGLRPGVDAIRAEVERVNRPCVLLGSSLAFPAQAARRLLNLPLVSVHLAPCLFWSAHAPPFLDPRCGILRLLPPFMVRWFYQFIDKSVEWRWAAPINRELVALNHPPLQNFMTRWIHSPDLTVGMFPEWFSPPERDWPAPHFLAGFPVYTETPAPLSAELETFLGSGEPPIAFAPGSANTQGASFFQESARALEKLGRRGVFVTPAVESVPRDLPPTILHVPYVPFERLFPRCAAVVFHGGIGTTAQCLKAGVPQLVMPMAHDQFDNGDRIRRLGVGRMLYSRDYRADSAARELGAVLANDSYRQKASALRERMTEGARWDELIGRMAGLTRT